MTALHPWRLSLGSQDQVAILDPSWSQISDAFFSLDGLSPRTCRLSLTSPQQQSLTIRGGHSLRFLVLFDPSPTRPAPAPLIPTRSLQAVHLHQTGPDLPLCLQPPLLSPAYATLSWPLLVPIARHFLAHGELYRSLPLQPDLGWTLETDPPPHTLPVPPSPRPDLAHTPTLLALSPDTSDLSVAPNWHTLITTLAFLDGQIVTHVFLTLPDHGTLAIVGGLQQRYAVFFFPHNQRFPVETLLAFDPSLAGPAVSVCTQPPTSSPARTALQQPLAWRILQHFYHTQTIPRDVHWLLDVQPFSS
ncbi:hypothetical protein [Thermogemmatispora carboxidivorans]|uniref:hypothetical protein n=1 Tax=Thermogemmatispora carboxidivorans TaxID=1382306 RepID=UPI0012DC01B5|nr:hypothetical protein [Thermogemmatispora carboxidivorans]